MISRRGPEKDKTETIGRVLGRQEEEREEETQADTLNIGMQHGGRDGNRNKPVEYLVYREVEQVAPWCARIHAASQAPKHLELQLAVPCQVRLILTGKRRPGCVTADDRRPTFSPNSKGSLPRSGSVFPPASSASFLSSAAL